MHPYLQRMSPVECRSFGIVLVPKILSPFKSIIVLLCSSLENVESDNANLMKEMETLRNKLTLMTCTARRKEKEVGS